MAAPGNGGWLSRAAARCERSRCSGRCKIPALQRCRERVRPSPAHCWPAAGDGRPAPVLARPPTPTPSCRRPVWNAHLRLQVAGCKHSMVGLPRFYKRVHICGGCRPAVACNHGQRRLGQLAWAAPAAPLLVTACIRCAGLETRPPRTLLSCARRGASSRALPQMCTPGRPASPARAGARCASASSAPSCSRWRRLRASAARAWQALTSVSGGRGGARAVPARTRQAGAGALLTCGRLACSAADRARRLSAGKGGSQKRRASHSSKRDHSWSASAEEVEEEGEVEDEVRHPRQRPRLSPACRPAGGEPCGSGSSAESTGGQSSLPAVLQRSVVPQLSSGSGGSLRGSSSPQADGNYGRCGNAMRVVPSLLQRAELPGGSGGWDCSSPGSREGQPGQPTAAVAVAAPPWQPPHLAAAAAAAAAWPPEPRFAPAERAASALWPRRPRNPPLAAAELLPPLQLQVAAPAAILPGQVAQGPSAATAPRLRPQLLQQPSTPAAAVLPPHLLQRPAAPAALSRAPQPLQPAAAEAAAVLLPPHLLRRPAAPAAPRPPPQPLQPVAAVAVLSPQPLQRPAAPWAPVLPPQLPQWPAASGAAVLAPQPLQRPAAAPPALPRPEPLQPAAAALLDEALPDLDLLLEMDPDDMAEAMLGEAAGGGP